MSLSSPPEGPRAVTDADFPADGPVHDQLAAMLLWAVHAPSVLNTQPWRFRVVGGSDPRVEVSVDRARVLQTVDPDGREAVISCGAALFTLRLAARHYDYADRVEYAGSGIGLEDGLVATFRLAGPAPATRHEEALFRAIKLRHTNRDPFADLGVPLGLLARLVSPLDHRVRPRRRGRAKPPPRQLDTSRPRGRWLVLEVASTLEGGA
ncbi:MAG: hypothetical protein WBA11_19310, partial [Rubrivirga sp.]